MMEPYFLTLADALEAHREQIRLYGGEDGVRDMALLESALVTPKSGIDGTRFHFDLFAMASAYLFHIARNHPFVDGNKRTGLACAYLFLAVNDFVLECGEDDLGDMVLSVARGEKDKDAITKFLRDGCKIAR